MKSQFSLKPDLNCAGGGGQNEKAVFNGFPPRHTPIGKPEVRNPESAFTLVELLVVLIVVGIIASLLLPALAAAKNKTKNNICLNNLKQLQLAWSAYADENDDRFVPNKSHQVGAIQRNIAPSWVLGNAKQDRSATNIEAGLLFLYVTSVGPYRCPVDKSLCSGPAPAPPRSRSYSLAAIYNSDMDGKGWNWQPGLRVGGPKRLNDIRKPPPSDCFVFLDEDEGSIDDGLFICTSAPFTSTHQWMEMPSDRHNQGCNISFADGHAAHHRWEAPKIFQDYDQPWVGKRDAEDLEWLELHRASLVD
jgi:prepilin-type processing-associated H-X9-DG protein/prepilin-type N-terminal cleavage/methylation domain-containing protein